jgi:hypothetical protein
VRAANLSSPPEQKIGEHTTLWSDLEPIGTDDLRNPTDVAAKSAPLTGSNPSLRGLRRAVAVHRPKVQWTNMSWCWILGRSRTDSSDAITQ